MRAHSQIEYAELQAVMEMSVLVMYILMTCYSGVDIYSLCQRSNGI